MAIFGLLSKSLSKKGDPYDDTMPSNQSDHTGGLFHVNGSERHVFFTFPWIDKGNT